MVFDALPFSACWWPLLQITLVWVFKLTLIEWRGTGRFQAVNFW
jgi:hypothetical protein